jgi:DNA-binding protein YbaB
LNISRSTYRVFSSILTNSSLTIEIALWLKHYLHSKAAFMFSEEDTDPSQFRLGHNMEQNDSTSVSRRKTTSELQAIEGALRDKTISVSVGDGSVKIMIDGFQQIRSIEIHEALLEGISTEELQWLQKILTVAVNKAIQQSQSMAFEQFGLLAERNLDASNQALSGA